MRRRALLSVSATGLAATAGCLGPAFGFGTDCPRGADLRLRPTTDADTADGASDPVESLSPPERAAARDALGGAEPTMWVPEPSSPPFSDSAFLAADGTYVVAETAVVSTADRTGYEFTLETGPETTATGDALAFADLPAVDRTAFYAALGYPGRREMERFERARSISIGALLAYPDDEAESRSELVPDPAAETLHLGGQEFRFRIERTKPTTVETRRVAVRMVADSTDEFVALVYDRYGVDLDERDLSAEQRDIVETAIDDGYDECAPYSEAYADLQRTLGRQVTRVTDDGDGVATTPAADAPDRVDYANYENEWYVVQLSEYVV
ncbi:hypothetical protein [Haloplanus rubicundus]|uniref:Uncharacterized protein n=1 Tax=Haloplanus rubicundus TaxID=1547898 RepID=A0A345ECI7_9EURY|nr:hypothetical protein [Haloplanus rubicundus]AXG09909.1 hypothetical protein DU484_08650 [Haloplanus rubicundus]